MRKDARGDQYFYSADDELFMTLTYEDDELLYGILYNCLLDDDDGDTSDFLLNSHKKTLVRCFYV